MAPPSDMSGSVHHIAVVGAGPSGLFTVAEISRRAPNFLIDVYDRDPTPFGLLRHGVAPDHLKIKSLAGSFEKTLRLPNVQFFGNILVGDRIQFEELLDAYDAVVVATGAGTTKVLSVDGIDLAIPASDVVHWYNGHPDAPAVAPLDLPVTHATIIGGGNVALDVGRILLKGSEGLAHTDMTATALSALSGGAQNVTLLIRGGIAQAKFTLAELLEFDNLDGVAPVVDGDDIRISSEEEALIAASPHLKQTVDVLTNWASRPRCRHPRRVHFRFYSTPQRVVGRHREVEAIDVLRTDGQAGYRLNTHAVISAAGYRTRGLAGVPFDEVANHVPNEASRVTGLPRVYVVGWAKRGPRGVIGTNKACARNTVDALFKDIEMGLVVPRTLCRRPFRDTSSLGAVTAEAWSRIDQHEIATGRAQGRARAKIGSRRDLLEIAGVL